MINKNDEIDLLALSRQMLVGLYYYIKRRLLLLLIFAGIGIIIGIGIHLKNRAVYNSQLIGSTYLIKPEIIIDLIEALNALNQTDKQQIQKVLSINNSDINHIARFSADTVKTFYKTIKYDKKSNNYVTIPDFTNIKVNIVYRNQIELDSLEKKIVNYLSNNYYVSQQTKIEKQRLNKLITKIDEEINNLDSLQNNILSASLINSNASLGQLMVLKDNSNTFFHKDIIKLEKDKQKYIKELARLSPLFVIKPFDKARIKEKTIIENITLFLGVFFSLGFFISLILEMRRKALKFIKEEQNN